ncbi:MAG: hypothetical protein Kow0042_15690 [Calditrichia bacterium]
MPKSQIIQDEIISRLNSIFIGREKEITVLKRLLDRTRQGLGSFVVISGEAGTGKSALVRQFVAQSSEWGVKYISESFRNILSYEPYLPFLNIVAKLGGSRLNKLMMNAHLSRKTEKAKFSNERGKTSWDIETLYSLQSEKGLAQQLIVSALLEASREHPLLISLTDIHCAPLTTWQFIHYLTQSIMDHPIMVIITLRQDGKVLQQEKVPLYADVLQRMNREGLIERVVLKRFSLREVKQFVRGLFKRTDFSSQFIPLLSELSGGLPLQLCKICQIFLEKGVIYHRNGVWFNKDEYGKNQLLEMIRQDGSLDQMAKELKHLSISQKTLLDYGTLQNGQMDHRILAAILNVSPIKVLKEFQNLTEKKILIADEEGMYQFRQPALQTLILEHIPAESRAALHLEIARAIERADHLEETRKIHLLAYHYAHTGEKKTAFGYLHKAGDQALRALAFNESMEYYRRAVEILPEISHQIAAADAVEMLLESAWVERILGYREQSLQRCQLARKMNEATGNQTSQTQICLQEAFSYLKLNDWEKAEVAFEACLNTGSETSDFTRAITYYGLGSIYFELAEYDLAKKYFEEGLKIPKAPNTVKLIANILNSLGALENVRGNYLRAISLYSKSIPLFREINDQSGLAQIYHNIGMTHAENERWKEANEFYGRCLAIADLMGLIPLKSICFLNRALALAHLGQFEDAREYNFKALRLLNQLHDELGIAEYHKIQGVIERKQGYFAESEKNFSEALQKFDKAQNKLGCAETEYEWACLARDMSDEEKMKYWAQKALNSFLDLGLMIKKQKIEKEFFQKNDEPNVEHLITFK